MSGGLWTSCPQPGTLRLRHRIAAERSFTRETSLFEFRLPSRHDPDCASGVRRSARRFPCEVNQVTQTVLGVLQFGAVSQPFPAQTRVDTQDPRKRFDKACVQIPRYDGAENHGGRIANPLGTNMLETGVAKRGQLMLKFVRRNFLHVDCLGQGKSGKRERIQACGAAGKLMARHPPPRFELRKIWLRYMQRTRG